MQPPRCVWLLLCGRNCFPVTVSKVLQYTASNAHCNLAVCIKLCALEVHLRFRVTNNNIEGVQSWELYNKYSEG